MILDDIVAKRKEQLARELAETDRQTMRTLALQTKRPVLSFPDALRTGRLSIIAEVKKASPSKSVICADFHPVEQAIAYERAGANAISCLTEEHYFQGSGQYFGTFELRFQFQCCGRISSLTPIKLMKHGS